MEIFNNVFKDKNVLVTGHTGFKGSWLSIWLKELGANVVGYALEPYTEKDNFVLSGLKRKMTHIIGDVRDFNNLKAVIYEQKPDFIFHLAAQSLVINSYRNPRETYETNIMGTVNLLEAVRDYGMVKAAVIVTSDKCYENLEHDFAYKESDAMGGYDPYSSSKGCAELVTAAYRNSFFKEDNGLKTALATARAGNVIGGGDWAENRIMPDCMKALLENRNIIIRNPESQRPWQHVLEPLFGYLFLAMKLSITRQKYCSAWNFGPIEEQRITVETLVQKIIDFWKSGGYSIEIGTDACHEAKYLSLNIDKSMNILKWQPVLDVEESIRMTVEWYKNHEKNDIYELCVSQIKDYINMANDKGILMNYAGEQK